MKTIFSPVETDILKIIKRRGRISIKDIAAVYFRGKKKPIDPNNVASCAVMRINKKCDFHKVNWFIDAEGLGRRGKTVWVQKR